MAETTRFLPSRSGAPSLANRQTSAGRYAVVGGLNKAVPVGAGILVLAVGQCSVGRAQRLAGCACGVGARRGGDGGGGLPSGIGNSQWLLLSML